MYSDCFDGQIFTGCSVYSRFSKLELYMTFDQEEKKYFKWVFPKLVNLRHFFFLGRCQYSFTSKTNWRMNENQNPTKWKSRRRLPLQYGFLLCRSMCRYIYMYFHTSLFLVLCHQGFIVWSVMKTKIINTWNESLDKILFEDVKTVNISWRSKLIENVIWDIIVHEQKIFIKKFTMSFFKSDMTIMNSRFFYGKK